MIERLVGGVMKGKVIHVELKTAVAPEPDQFVHLVDISGLPKGAMPITLYSPSLTSNPRKAVKAL